MPHHSCVCCDKLDDLACQCTLREPSSLSGTFLSPFLIGRMSRFFANLVGSTDSAKLVGLIGPTFLREPSWKYSSKLYSGSKNLRSSPFLTGRMFVRPNILRTLRRTMIRFLIEHLVRRIWFGQSRLYFILNWLVMRCKLRPELAADAQQTA